MPAKGGSSRDCCCGGCFRKAFENVSSQDDFQPIRQFCCACIPQHICVWHDSVSGSELDIFTLIEVNEPLCEPEGTPLKWEGDFGIGGAVVDVEFRFVIENTKCYLALWSDYYEIAGEVRVEMTPANRDILCPPCDPCGALVDEPQYLEYPITVTGSGTANDIIIKVRPASGKSLSKSPGRKRCCDCPDPCYPDSETVEDDCEPRCTDCNCICDKVCVSVVLDGELVSQEQITLCNWSYTGTTATISIPQQTPPGCACVLKLDEVPGYTWYAPPDDVPIGTIDNPCPRPTAAWAFYDQVTADPAPDPLPYVQVFFSCAGCGGCDTIVDSLCESCPAPRVLNMSVSAQALGVESGSGTGSGTCCSSDIALIYGGANLWEGDGLTSWCGASITGELACTGSGSGTSTNQYSLNLTASNCVEDGSGDPEIQATLVSFNCDPFRLEFTARVDDEFPGGGPWCCFTQGGGALLTIVITE